MYYGNKVILRGLELSDVDHIMKKWNTLELRKTLGSMIPYSIKEEEDWVRNSWEQRSKGTGYGFAITDYKNNFLGTTGLFSINRTCRSAELGIAIHDEKNQGKGYGTDAVSAITAFAFKVLNFHRVRLTYVDANPGAKAYYKAGYTEIGRERDGIFILGEYKDLIVMDILEKEFNDKFPEYTLFPKI